MLGLGLESRGCNSYSGAHFCTAKAREESQSHTDLGSLSLLDNLEWPNPVFTPVPTSQDAQSQTWRWWYCRVLWGTLLGAFTCSYLTSLSVLSRFLSLWILQLCKWLSAKFCRSNLSKPFNGYTISSSLSCPSSWKWKESEALTYWSIRNLGSVYCSHHCPECDLKNPLDAAVIWFTRCECYGPSFPFKETARLKAWDQNIKASIEIWHVLHLFTH